MNILYIGPPQKRVVCCTRISTCPHWCPQIRIRIKLYDDVFHDVCPLQSFGGLNSFGVRYFAYVNDEV